jgi:hypothetical protein
MVKRQQCAEVATAPNACLEVRTQVLNGTLEGTFQRYPGFRTAGEQQPCHTPHTS